MPGATPHGASVAAAIVAKAQQQKSQGGKEQEDELIEKAGKELLDAIEKKDAKDFMRKFKHIVYGFQAKHTE